MEKILVLPPFDRVVEQYGFLRRLVLDCLRVLRGEKSAQTYTKVE